MLTREQRLAKRVVVKQPLLWEQPHNECLAVDKVITDYDSLGDPFDDGMRLTVHAVDYDISVDRYFDEDDEFEGLTIVECSTEEELFHFCTGYEELA